MNPLKLFLTAFFLGTAPMALAGPAQVDVDWSNHVNYKDIRTSGSESQADFEHRLFTSLEKLLSDQAGKLPEDYRLTMRVDDLSLAGYRDSRGGTRSVRVYRDGYPARLEFQYALYSETGELLKEGSETLQSSSFTGTTGRTSRNEPFQMEKKLLRDWFQKTVLR